MAGRAYIVFGTRTPHDIDLAALGSAGITLIGERHHFPDAFGWQVAGVGDVDRDGHADVAIAAPGNSGFEDDYTKGRAYVVFGRHRAGAIRMSRLGRAGFRIGFGEVTAVSGAGDVNGDGRRDIAVLEDSVHIVYGRRYRHPVDLAHLGRHGLTIRARTRNQFQGGALAGGRDTTGDGVPDLVIGEPMAHYFGLGPANGGVVLVPGSASARPLDLAAPGRRAWEPATGVRGWMAGSSVALGRVNGDRRADIVLVANGSLAVLYGSAMRTTLRLNAIPADRGFLIDGAIEPAPSGAPAGRGGFASTAARDLNADGRAELLAGAPFAGHQDRAFSGSVYLFFAP
jgi:hypothetical protein